MPNNTNNTTEMLNSQIAALRSQDFQTDDTGEFAEINYPYVIFQLHENRFAVNCKYVVSIEQTAKTTEIVNASREARRISYYKNEPISIFDLRSLFGLISSEDYINNVVNLPQRIKDHEKYAQTLNECVETGAPFNLTVDPHMCAFGKWFYAYKEDKRTGLEIRNLLTKIEKPHAKFHETAKTVRELIKVGKFEETAEHLKIIERLKGGCVTELTNLHEMLLKNTTELNIVLQLKNQKIGLTVDYAESVENIDEIQPLPPSVATTNYIKRLGLSQKERQIIFIIEAPEFQKS